MSKAPAGHHGLTQKKTKSLRNSFWLLHVAEACGAPHVRCPPTGKIIGELLNLDDPKLGLPPSPLKVMRSFNARPVLTRPQHLVVHADGHTELAIVVHDFPYVALSGLHSSLDVIPDFVFKMGLVLEGRSDDELPEMLLTCVTVNGLDLRKAVPW